MDFSAIPVRNWTWGGDVLYLYLYCNKTWTDAAGVTHLRSAEGSGHPYQKHVGIVTDFEAVINSFETSPTVNALEGKDVRITGILVDEDLIEREPLFKNKRIPTTPDPLTYAAFLTFNKACAKALRERYGTIEDFMALLATFIGSVLAASRVVMGAVFLNIDPTDPLHPEAVGSNSPGFAVAAGIETLVDGRATVLSDDVLLTSGIQATGLSVDADGAMHVENIVAGVSFDIVSDNLANTGNVMWSVYNNL